MGSPPPEPQPFARPAWWGELHDARRPVVHVTQGTLDRDPRKLLVPALRALAREDVLVVATTGHLDPAQVPLDPLPTNVRLEPFLPHAQLLPHVDVMVSNAGFGGVRAALAHGIPLVVAGQTEEKIETSARVAWSGAGVDLRTETPSPRRLRRAVGRVLGDPCYRSAARRLQGELAASDAPGRCAELVEALARTGCPVLRRAAPGPQRDTADAPEAMPPPSPLAGASGDTP